MTSRPNTTHSHDSMPYDESVLLSPAKLHEIIEASICKKYEDRIAELEREVSTAQQLYESLKSKESEDVHSELATRFEELIRHIEENAEMCSPKKKRRHECLINSCKTNTERLLYNENVDVVKALTEFKKIVVDKEKEGANIGRGMMKWISARIKAEIE